MPGLDPVIAVEIDKLIEAGFIRDVQYPKWISNIVIVLKKSGQIRVCVDFRDLNDACRSLKSWWTQPLATRHCHS
ncbi:hypothetical protein FF2_032609 [Malus domestica]